MFSKSIKHFIIGCSHSVLHRTSLYYEKAKESSINIKKMTITDKIALSVFYFKKKIFVLKTKILPQEVFNG
jgi:hypothetical protein